MTPIDYKKYPANWKGIRTKIMGRAGNQCECMGECGLHRTTPGPRRCEEIHHEKAKWARGRVVLTIAHLWQGPCKCDHKCGHLEHLKALCQRCHLRYDLDHHKRRAAATRWRKRTRIQPELFPWECP